MQYIISGSELLEQNPDFTLVGRSQEMDRLTSVLMRNKASSVLLVGPGGVGASALIMGLQSSKADKDTPFDVVSKRIFWLKTDELFSAGSEEINKGFNNVMDILKRTPDSILVIEDGRDFIEAARNAGCGQFVNQLNSLVKNKQTQVIIEVRDPDLDMVLASHSDMKQCYTVVDVNEPSTEDLYAIVSATSANLAKHHSIKINDDAVHAAIELTTKYRSRDSSLSRAQPERSTNLIDRALSSYRLEAHAQDPRVKELIASGLAETSPEVQKVIADFAATKKSMLNLFEMQRDGELAIIELEERIAEIQKEEAAKPSDEPHKLTAYGMESPAVVEMRNKIRQYQSLLSKNKAEYEALAASVNDRLSLTKEYVYAEFSRLSGIPAAKLNEDEKVKLRGLEQVLNSRVFGQASVIKRIADAIKVARIKKRGTGKPQAAFLIMGPSGTGKTEVCKAMAYALKDDESALTRFDMSEYMEKHSVAKLIGAPAGYEGSERGGVLTNAMRQNPHRIILFDEIEKADPSIFDLFLQILSDGRLTDNHGRTVDFSNSIIIMTTNIGQTFFLDESLDSEEAERLANVELDQVYRPEFLNRFAGRQNIVCFNRLELDSIQKIVKRELNNLSKAYIENGITITYTNDTVMRFCADHYQPRHGARGLQGHIEANVEPLIVSMILDSGVSNAELTLEYNNGKFELTHGLQRSSEAA